MNIGFFKRTAGTLRSLLLFSLLFVFVQEKVFATTKSKKYSDIGITKTASVNKINRFYVGIDFYWLVRRFDTGRFGIIDIKKNAIHESEFFSRFKNLSTHIGWRMNEYIAIELGYLHFGNTINLASVEEALNGAFTDVYFYQKIMSNKYTCLETYATIGFFFTHGSVTKQYGYGFKTGAGLQLKIYGPVAIKVGIDYYYPGSDIFSKKGFLTLKTGFDLYFIP